jgi:hypothetical protein
MFFFFKKMHLLYNNTDTHREACSIKNNDQDSKGSGSLLFFLFFPLRTLLKTTFKKTKYRVT